MVEKSKYQVVSIKMMYVNIVWYNAYFISYFCPNVKMYYFKNAHYMGYLGVHCGVALINTIIIIICIYIHIYMCVYVRTRTCMYVCVSKCIFMYMHFVRT